MQVFLVRGGKLIGQEHFILEGVYEQSDEVLTGEFLKQFYTARTAGAPDDKAYSTVRIARDNQAPVPEKRRSRAAKTSAAAVPKELLVSALPDERATIESWLSEIKGQRVRILQPQRGARADYMRLVQKNAEQNLKAFLAHQEVQETAQARSLTDLADALELPEPPHRIECYDVSNIQGTNPTASMVVFVEGRAKKSEYRKFKIQYDRGPNDFAMMQEALRRRLRYLRRETDRTETPLERELAKKEKFNKKPDLLLIDGGKGQLSAVVEVLEELDMTGLVAAGLAKEHEWLYLPNQSDPIVLPPNSPALHLIQRIRDEAHRFAVTYHRQRRAKSMTRSALDALAGVGPVRKKRLLTAFGSPAGIRRAKLDEIAAVKGMTPALAAKIKQELEGGYRS
jgi:excinuclease ABC subunit C